MSGRVGKMLRAKVCERAGACCEYCGMPDDVVLAPHEPDHIVATQHGGATLLENLAYTCHQCNRYKGPNLASIDPASGERTFLFNPRTDRRIISAGKDHELWQSQLLDALRRHCSASMIHAVLPLAPSFCARATIHSLMARTPLAEARRFSLVLRSPESRVRC